MGRLRAGLLVFLGVFAVYVYTAYPTVAPRDSGDLAAAVLDFRPAHPPGYPLYVLLGKAWISLIPWGEPAYRLNLMSAAAGAGCVATLFLLLARSCGTWPGLAAALALAFSAPLWKFSLLCEMYSLHGLLLAVLLLLAPGPGQDEGSGRRRLRWSAFLLGLALVNHQAFLLAVPGLAVLWWEELSSAANRRLLWTAGLPLLLLGLAPYLFLWVRLGDLGRAWAVLTRQEYGTWQLSAGLSRPMSWGLAASLLGHFFKALWQGTSPVVLGLALLGAVDLALRVRRFAAGLLALLLCFGPAFYLATRFDLSGWVARTVMESALVAPAVLVCLCAGFGLAWALRRKQALGLVLAAAAVLGPLWQNGAASFHRDDFSAYDYALDLRRALPPGSTAVVGGDTALYASRYLDLAHPDGQGRRLVFYQDASPGARPDFVLGLSLARLAALGLGPEKLYPAGLAQGLLPASAAVSAWEFSALRRGQALRQEESYARDILLSYAFAHYLDGVLRQARRDPGAQRDFALAAALDPEDYRLEYEPAPAPRDR
ncbi:MAG: DUF2723 domain-containing protein [Elusimicrobia bacterium]|nr:DUF2723 domain-containing protein [Elusimicrobiota bacterium]